MFKTLSELRALEDMTVVVEYSSARGSEIVKAEGKLLRAGAQGVVFESRGKTVIVPLGSVIDLYEFTQPRKVVRRKVQHLLQRRARQHLLDRHGIPWDLVKFTTDQTAFDMHQQINHANLGHQHRGPEEVGPEEEEALS
jgi:hypothetical protein